MWFNRDVQKTLRILIVLLSILGVVVSALALQVHYSNKLEPCDINAHWDCGIVNHSWYSSIARCAGCCGWHCRISADRPAGAAAEERLDAGGGGGGLCYALYLSHVEDSILQVWCLYCVISQCMIALIAIFAGDSLVAGRKQQSTP